MEHFYRFFVIMVIAIVYYRRQFYMRHYLMQFEEAVKNVQEDILIASFVFVYSKARRGLTCIYKEMPPSNDF